MYPSGTGAVLGDGHTIVSEIDTVSTLMDLTFLWEWRYYTSKEINGKGDFS